MEHRTEPEHAGYPGMTGFIKPGIRAASSPGQAQESPKSLPPFLNPSSLAQAEPRSRFRLYYGRDEIKVIPIPLRAGCLTMEFDPETAGLRHVSCGRTEVIRGIYGAVRDRFWNTVPIRLSNVKVDAHPDSFRLTFEVLCQQGEIDFSWRGEITGDARGTVRFGFDGEARSSFLRRRIGLCLLHPVKECAGNPGLIERMDGTQAQVVFPYFISPQQPMRDLRAITHEVEPGLWAEVRFSGDVFETEDQRNWTDDSYKTYSAPLDLPSPTLVGAGVRVEQGITISLLGKSLQPPIALGETSPEWSAMEQAVKPKSAVGLGYASHGSPLSHTELERLNGLGLAHFRLDLQLQDPAWKPLLQQATQEARALGIGLHLAAHLSNEAESELTALAQAVVRLDSPILLWMVLPLGEAVTPDPWLRMAIRILQPLAPQVPFAAGTDLYFAELNCQRPAIDSPALPCFSLNPQVHACDDATLVENLSAQRYTLETLQQFSRSPAVISPITLRPRFNPNAGTFGVPTELPALPFGADVRQLSLLGAGWTLGSLAALMGTGNLHSLTYYETTGCLGVMETKAGSFVPDQFPSIAGGVFPMYHVFADLADCSHVFAVQNSHPQLIQGLGLITRENRRRVLLANVTGRPQNASLRTGGGSVRLKFLDEVNGWESSRNPEVYRGQTAARLPVVGGCLQVKLLPYALVRLDFD